MIHIYSYAESEDNSGVRGLDAYSFDNYLHCSGQKEHILRCYSGRVTTTIRILAPRIHYSNRDILTVVFSNDTIQVAVEIARGRVTQLVRV